MRRIIVIRAGALGDGLLTVPALAAIRTRWPEASLTLVGPRPLLPFALATGYAHRALAVEDEAGLLLFADSPVPAAYADFDLAIIWLRQWSDVATRLRPVCPHVLAGPSLPADGTATHVADHLLHLLEPWSLGPGCPRQCLAAPAAALQAAQRWWEQYAPPGVSAVVAIHPGSGGAPKCWPQQRFAALGERLLASGVGLLLCCGPAEADSSAFWRSFVEQHPSSALADQLDLAMLAAVLRRCAVYVGNDAGITHLAAALGLPTLAIFGPTDPHRWAPVGRRVQVLQDPGWAGHAGNDAGQWQLTAAAVATACRDILASPQV